MYSHVPSILLKSLHHDGSNTFVKSYMLQNPLNIFKANDNHSNNNSIVL